MEIVLATQNPDKVREIKEVLKDLPIKILTLMDLGLKEKVEETGKTLEENALLKAKFWAEKTGKWALADDTGLEVEALNGAPGVHTSRYAGENASYEDNWKKLLKNMEGIPWEKRKARFRCVIVIVSPQGKRYIAEGSVEGYITLEAKGNKGFGYDPVFYVPEKGKTLAEMSLEEKNSLSHRGKALQKAKEIICNIITSSSFS